jgi:glycosyltransferase involved in cell wall biosynthesis
LITLTETLVEDRGVYPRRSAVAALARLLDRASLSAATRVIIDAAAHRQYLVDTFGVTPERVSTWHLGADAAVFQPQPPPRREGPLRVLFYGSFLPLHGVRTIVRAATLLKDRLHIEFTLVGDGPEHAAAAADVRDAGLTRVRLEHWVPYASLGRLVADADICLGIFGKTAKSRMVIPNKVYQTAAVGRPVITADTPAIREVFEHAETAWLCPAGDAAALAAAIEALCGDGVLREAIGRRAAALMAERFSPPAQGRRLAAIFAETVQQA